MTRYFQITPVREEDTEQNRREVMSFLKANEVASTASSDLMEVEGEKSGEEEEEKDNLAGKDKLGEKEVEGEKSGEEEEKDKLAGSEKPMKYYNKIIIKYIA